MINLVKIDAILYYMYVHENIDVLICINTQHFLDIGLITNITFNKFDIIIMVKAFERKYKCIFINIQTNAICPVKVFGFPKKNLKIIISLFKM